MNDNFYPVAGLMAKTSVFNFCILRAAKLEMWTLILERDWYDIITASEIFKKNLRLDTRRVRNIIFEVNATWYKSIEEYAFSQPYSQKDIRMLSTFFCLPFVFISSSRILVG